MTDTLIAVRDLMADPAHWTKGDYNDNFHNPTCFCLTGAVAYIENFLPMYDKLDKNDTVILLANLIEDDAERICLVGASEIVAEWNDEPHRKHDDIINLLDKALEPAS